MVDELDALLERVADEGIRAELKDRIDRLRRRRDFGLVFEEHLPERVRLPDHPIRRGSVVVRKGDPSDTSPQRVIRVSPGAVVVGASGDDTEQFTQEELVVVAAFGEPIYPGLERIGSIARGSNGPTQIVIKGENYHALEALRFSHTGMIDCIYIDPPYNKGKRDWKYDNDYVDEDDAYRHSKWLAFMARRLDIARDLLRPEASTLIVAIDETEVHRLGLLLEQKFPASDIQTVTVVSNPAGSPRVGRFTRVEEYLFFVFVGDAVAGKWRTSMLDGDIDTPKLPNVWFSAARVGGGGALRANRTTPVLFYPVHIDSETGALHSVGDPVPASEDIAAYEPPTGTTPIWPLATDGTEQTWRFRKEQMEQRFNEGTVRLGRRDAETGHRPVTYLRPGTLKKIEKGEYVVKGRTEEGAVVLALAEGATPEVAPAAVWRMQSHFARDYGTAINKALVPGSSFPFPKSLYAVEDALRIAVGSNPDARVLDFFAGSGTTTHAVMRLNRQDGGRRQSISITNNEVSESEAEALAKDGLRPGDDKWERLGIFESVTRPRLTAALTGEVPGMGALHDSYGFVDEFPMEDGFEEDVEFLELKYLDLEDVELDLAFERIAPLLWLRAGGTGPILDRRTNPDGQPRTHATTSRYGVLFDPDDWRAFVDSLPASAVAAFVVTDAPSVFASVAAELPSGLDVVRLYQNYISSFEIGGFA